MDFSYKEYRKIIDHVSYHLPIVSFKEAKTLKKFCVIRHDVEYSPERAIQIANFESSIGVNSSYCFQLRNNCYNTLSAKNLDIVREIYNMGHSIAAHIHMDDCIIGDEESYILNDIQTIERYSKIKVEGWSIHRPKGNILSHYKEVPGYLNYNGKDFFHYTEQPSFPLNVTYLSDSNHQWKYGHPLRQNFNRVNKLQINCHPFSWSEKGLGNTENFTILSNEKELELINSINDEIKNYPKELYEQKCNILTPQTLQI